MNRPLIFTLVVLAASIPLVASAEPSGCYDPAVFYDSDSLDGVYEAYLIDRPESGISCSLGSGSSRVETQAFLGLTFTFGHEEFVQRVSAGVRQVEVQSSDNVSGGELNFSSSLNKLGQDAIVRVIALNGTRNVLSNVGVGYQFADSDWLLNAGVQIPYARIYGDYGFKSGVLTPSLELNSFGKIDPVGSACQGIEVNPEELLQTLVDQGVLLYGGDLIEGSIGDIYTGTFESQGHDFSFNGSKNDAVYSGANKTCLTLSDGAIADVD